MDALLREMMQSVRDLEDRYRILGDDLAIYDKLEKVRQARASGFIERVRKQRRSKLSLVPEKGIATVSLAELTKTYDTVFSNDLSVNPGSSSFDVHEVASRLMDRPGQRQFATFLIDWSVVRAELMAETLQNIFQAIQGSRNQRQLNEIESIRWLAQQIDDRDEWTRQFYLAISPPPWKALRPRALQENFKKLAKDAKPQEVPISKLTIVAEVLWEQDRDAAIEFLKGVLKVHLNDYWVNTMLAEMLAVRDQPGDLNFELELRRAAYLNQKPLNAVTCLMLGDAHMRRGNVEDAKRYSDEAYDRDSRLRPVQGVNP